MNEPVDFTIVGSGFGGSVSAMRLAEKGYSVLVLERGKRYTADTFPKTNWNIFKYLWLPAARCFGIMGINFLDDMMILNGSGVGGGSLVYASTHIRPGRVFTKRPNGAIWPIGRVNWPPISIRPIGCWALPSTPASGRPTTCCAKLPKNGPGPHLQADARCHLLW
jgi:hypothetical protein